MATSADAGPNYPYALTWARYREVLDADFTRMRALAERARYEPVPFCEGWRGEDVLRHTATVYLHKVAAMASGRSDQPPQPWPPEHLGAVDAVDLLDDGYRQLADAFDTRDPADPSWTWWPDDQSVGFWLRRMAHETSIHRRDVENAVGEGSPVAADLAVDGIDEVLAQMLEGDWSPAMVDEASGRTVEVAAGGHTWSMTLDPASVGLRREPTVDPTADQAAGPAATVAGEPGELLLWLWGRAPLTAVTGAVKGAVSGDVGAAQELRSRLALATQ